ncbi:BA75_04417T0 [Komagataella pastoris]|uniref:Protein YIP n=1 Tax=Komagataella pastoris TaxID=4922 RepID=A0A1B2JHH6_PICPA|nr:BA75_04417T0 [Komagataella pastoris]
MSFNERQKSEKSQSKDDLVIEADTHKHNNRRAGMLPPSDTSIDRSSIGGQTTYEVDGFFALNGFKKFTTLLQLQPESTFGERIDTQILNCQFKGLSTIDESILATIKRDVTTIGYKLLQILWPIDLRETSNAFANRGQSLGNDDDFNSSEKAIRMILEWDLWGPLVFALGYSLILTLSQKNRSHPRPTETSEIFSGVFTLLSFALCALSLNIQLLAPLDNGSTLKRLPLSFFQGLSILGYCFFPVFLGSLLSLFVSFKLVQVSIQSAMLVWSIYCVYFLLNFMQKEGENRLFLSVYPVLLVFGTFSWLFIVG